MFQLVVTYQRIINLHFTREWIVSIFRVTETERGREGEREREGDKSQRYRLTEGDRDGGR